MFRVGVCFLISFLFSWGVQASLANQCSGIYQKISITDYFADLRKKFEKEQSNETKNAKDFFWREHTRFGFVQRNDRWILIAKNLDLAKTLVQELTDYYLKHHPGAELIKPDFSHQYIASISGVQVDVSSLLPKKLSDFVSNRAYKSGPNCWNACLVYSEILPELRHSPDYEIDHWLRSPLLEQDTSAERISADDILVIKKNGQHEHANIMISKNIALSKNGLRPESQYELQDIHEMFDHYWKPGVEIQNFHVVYLSNLATPEMPQQYYDLLYKTEQMEQLISKILLSEQKTDAVKIRALVVSFAQDNFGIAKAAIAKLGGPEAYFQYQYNKKHSLETQMKLTLWMGLYMRLYSLSYVRL